MFATFIPIKSMLFSRSSCFKKGLISIKETLSEVCAAIATPP
jgi:hypothetical protein